MRVKEPLNGFMMAQGQIIFHIALISASFFILGHPYPLGDSDKEEADSEYNIECIVWMIR